MPYKDKTGPLGEGSKTGRQLGNCEGAVPSETVSRQRLGFGRGFGCGRGMGRGQGCRRGFGRGFGFRQSFTKEDEKKLLEAELKELELEKKELEKSLKEMN